MSEKLLSINQALAERFDGRMTEFAGEITLIFSPEKILDAARAIHDEFKFDLLSAVTSVDYWPQEDPRFHVCYRFTSIAERLFLNVRVPVSATSPVVPTLEKIYSNANWQEREVYDLMGIKFEGHSDLRRIMMPQDWQGHPLRKDYALGYEEPQFSFNYGEIDVRKPHAQNITGE